MICSATHEHAFIQSIFAAAAGLLIAAGAAQAHPHVWVTMTSTVIYAPDGTVTGVRHAWTFDDMFSTFAIQGLESKQKGVFTREELQPLAEVNVTSLKEYEYFSYAKANGKKTQFTDPVDYYLEHKDSLLTLHFTLPLKTPMKAQSLELEVFDPAYFIDFTFAEKDAVAAQGRAGGLQGQRRQAAGDDARSWRTGCRRSVRTSRSRKTPSARSSPTRFR